MDLAIFGEEVCQLSTHMTVWLACRESKIYHAVPMLRVVRVGDNTVHHNAGAVHMLRTDLR